MDILDRLETDLSWWDFVSEDYVYMREPPDDETALRLIPQWPAAQKLYILYRRSHDDILTAMVTVLEKCLRD